MKKGYTLLELAVVLAIIASTFGLVSVGYSTLYNKVESSRVEANVKAVTNYVDWVYFTSNNNVTVASVVPLLQKKIFLKNIVTMSTSQELCTISSNVIAKSNTSNAVIYISAASLYDAATMQAIETANDLKGTVLVVLTPTTYSVTGY